MDKCHTILYYKIPKNGPMRGLVNQLIYIYNNVTYMYYYSNICVCAKSQRAVEGMSMYLNEHHTEDIVFRSQGFFP